MFQVQEIIDSVKAELIRYKESKPHLSWRAVSKNSGVNRYFISKILEDDGEYNSTKNVDLNQLLLLMQFLHHRGKGNGQDDDDSLVQRVLMQVFPPFSEGNAGENHLERVSLDLGDFNYYFILSLASSEKGISPEAIEKIFGSKAMRSVQYLLDFEYLIEDSDGFLKKNPSLFLEVPATTKNRLAADLLTRFLVCENEGSQVEGKSEELFMHTSLLNQKGFTKLLKAHLHFKKVTTEILSNSDFEGDIPVFVVNSMGTLM